MLFQHLIAKFPNVSKKQQNTIHPLLQMFLATF